MSPITQQKNESVPVHTSLQTASKLTEKHEWASDCVYHQTAVLSQLFCVLAGLPQFLFSLCSLKQTFNMAKLILLLPLLHHLHFKPLISPTALSKAYRVFRAGFSLTPTLCAPAFLAELCSSLSESMHLVLTGQDLTPHSPY